MRRLPVYILIDTSTSMRGEPIAAVEHGLKTLISSLRTSPFALERVWLSIITCNSQEKQILPLTELIDIKLNEIRISQTVGKDCFVLSEAFDLLCEKVGEEVHKSTPETKGDWKPLLFILSDGGYSGPIAKHISEFKKLKFGLVVACVVSSKKKVDIFQGITQNVIQISSINAISMELFFQWVSSSIVNNF